ncbi:hypothetical protein KFE96_07310 [Kordiimonas sp. SCSIO 12603]|uniref:KAP family P-loop NTPase fold protein n=1 Tax=Kordiimonas sp. SCSIO 12603 TaxID=2829596 RepID=UPI002105D9B9|nr:P-loop NTPase fold protein [Kordiimonas sp. SCSIO 12603]UTW60110.1 hypothetical protein KFE96_07310 [Kordiimonas sp. SCSIO 12603]
MQSKTLSKNFKNETYVAFAIVDDELPVTNNFLTIAKCNFKHALALPPKTNLVRGIDYSARKLQGLSPSPYDKYIYDDKKHLLLLNDVETTPLISAIYEVIAERYQTIADTHITIDDYYCWPDLNSNNRSPDGRPVQIGNYIRIVNAIIAPLNENFPDDIHITFRIHTRKDTSQKNILNFQKRLHDYASKSLNADFSVLERHDGITTIKSKPHKETKTGNNPPPLSPEEPLTLAEHVSCDHATSEDRLNFRPLARALKAFLTHKDTNLPLTIAVDGPWGSGKSSFMMMLEKEISPTASAPKKTGKFSWWREIKPGLELLYHATASLYPLLIIIALYAFLFQEYFSIYWDIGIITGFASLYLIFLDWGIEQTQKIKEIILPPHDKKHEVAFITIQINAWRHGHGTRLKAAIMKKVIDQLIEKRGIRFLLDLHLKRFNRLEYLKTLFFNIFRSNLLIWPAAIIGTAIFLYDAKLITTGPEWLKSGYNGYTIMFPIWAVVSYFGKATKSLKFENLFQQPDYEQLAGPDEEIEEDFNRIVELLKTENTFLAVFIDDLDRCSPKAVHEVVEALNVFFGAQSRECLFVLGMHKEMVANALEVAYEKTAKKLSENPLLKDQQPYGRRFLEKIVQFVVHVPSSNPETIRNYLSHLSIGEHSGTTPVGQTPISSSPNINTATDQKLDSVGGGASIDINGEDTKNTAKMAAQKQQKADEMQDIELEEASNLTLADVSELRIIEMVVPILKSNPRQFKRFFSLVRFNYHLPTHSTLENEIILATVILEFPELYYEARRRVTANNQLEKTDNLLESMQTIVAQITAGKNQSILNSETDYSVISDLLDEFEPKDEEPLEEEAEEEEEQEQEAEEAEEDFEESPEE